MKVTSHHSSKVQHVNTSTWSIICSTLMAQCIELSEEFLKLHLYYINKVAFWLSENPLCFNMGAQWHLYFFRRVQYSLTWHVLQADMLAICKTALSCLAQTWLACTAVGCMYGRPGVTECEHHVCKTQPHVYDWRGGGAGVHVGATEPEQYIIEAMPVEQAFI